MLPSLRRPRSVGWRLLSAVDRRRRRLPVLARPSSSTSRPPPSATADDDAFLRSHPPRAIDVHTHMYPPASYMKLLRSRTDVPRVVSIGGQDRLIILPGEDEETTTAAGVGVGRSW